VQHHQRGQAVLGQVLDPMQHGVEARFQSGVFHPLGAVEGRSVNRKCEPVIDVRLHQCPIFSPVLPPARGNRRDVTDMTLCSALEVVAANEWWALACSLQYEEASEQLHRWPHPYKHLAEVDEDGHQRIGVGREVLQLEPVILQQREEEGGQCRHQPSQGICRKENKVPWPRVGQRRGPCFSLGARPGAFHPISRRKLA
jgi:hypothetical protein